MAAAVAQFYFRFRVGWRHFLQKINVYQHIKYRQDNSIHGRYITISVLQKQTSAILKFFFRFWLWPRHRNPHEILHKTAKLHPYRTTFCGNMTSYQFSRWRPRPLNITSGFVFADTTALRKSKSISKPNFVDIAQFTTEISAISNQQCRWTDAGT